MAMEVEEVEVHLLKTLFSPSREASTSDGKSVGGMRRLFHRDHPFVALPEDESLFLDHLCLRSPCVARGNSSGHHEVDSTQEADDCIHKVVEVPKKGRGVDRHGHDRDGVVEGHRNDDDDEDRTSLG